MASGGAGTVCVGYGGTGGAVLPAGGEALDGPDGSVSAHLGHRGIGKSGGSPQQKQKSPSGGSRGWNINE